MAKAVTAVSRVLIELTHTCGPWNDDIGVKELREIAKREALEAANQAASAVTSQTDCVARVLRLKETTVTLIGGSDD